MLSQIIARKRIEIEESKERVSSADLRARTPDTLPPSFRTAVGKSESINIVAEIKYSSPSHGPFADQRPPEEIASDYIRGGAVAGSVLTDREFFRGDPEHLRLLRREFPSWPTLRKDFVLDPYQVLQARAWGASAYLLIAACLGPADLEALLEMGTEMSIDPLVEIHDRRELEMAVEAGAELIGVNNRNLKTFEVDLRTSFQIARELEGESGFVLISESGIGEHSQIRELRDAGFNGFLIGSSLMDSGDPASVLRRLRGDVGREEEATHAG